MSAASDWSFDSYEKIAESTDRWQLDAAAHRALARTPWVVTEKIHGANFALVTDGTAVRCAKRKELLADGEDFFGHRALLGALEPAARAVFDQVLGPRAPAGARLVVYGELFGGGYPHPDVAPDPSAQPVQTGVYYCPGVAFCAFDVAVEQPGDRAAPRRYLDQDEALRVCERAGLLFARPLAVARLEDALQYPLGFDSHVPGWLGLPPLPVPNPAEGVVVKPLRSVVVAGARGAVRPVLKRKIAAFAEDARFHQATRWAEAPRAGAGAAGWLHQVASALATEQRLASAVSKLGRAAGREARARAVAEDIRAELEEAHGAELHALASDARRALEAHVRREAVALVELYSEG